MRNRTHYEVLGVSPTASEAEIKAAYKSMMRAFHPDKNLSNQPYATEMTKVITLARDILLDQKKRGDYDNQLRWQSGENRAVDAARAAEERAKEEEVKTAKAKTEEAKQQRDLENIKSYLASNGDVNTKHGGNCRTFLILAALGSQLETVRFLLKVPGIDIDATDSGGATALYFAVNESQESIVEALLDAGANPDIMNKCTKCTAEDLAIKLNNSKVLAVLAARSLLFAARVKVANLINEIYAGNIQVLKEFIIANRDNPYVMNALRCKQRGHAALLLAVVGLANQCDMVQLLIGVPGINLDVKTDCGKTALHLAAERGRADIVEILLMAGATTTILDDEGRTAEQCVKNAKVLTKFENIKIAQAASASFFQPASGPSTPTAAVTNPSSKHSANNM